MASNYHQLQASAKKILEFKQNNVKEILKLDPSIADVAAEEILEKITDEITLDIVGEYHKAVKLGYGEYFCAQIEGGTENTCPQPNNRLFEDDENESEKIKCPKCARPMNALRFTTHLGNCMKMGRISFRIANRRIANNSKENSYGGMMSDDDDDDDWNAITEKIKINKKLEPKKKKDKPRKTKSLKSAKDDIFENESGVSAPNFSKLLTMTSDERMSFFSITCAVKNEITGKLCIKSIRCNQHNDEERVLIRKMFPMDSGAGETYVDIEEIESHSSKNETEHSSTSSPADSTSTSSSSSTKRREKYKHKNIKTKGSDVICPE